jgi:hypothetical protein
MIGGLRSAGSNGVLQGRGSYCEGAGPLNRGGKAEVNEAVRGDRHEGPLVARVAAKPPGST